MKIQKPSFIYIDGASKGNPGPSGIGILIDDGSSIREYSFYIGTRTNNETEYIALITALEKALSLGLKNIKLFSDSELLVNQMNGKYKIKSKNIIQLAIKAQELKRRFESIEIVQISRELNKKANALAQMAAKAFQ
ncbi:MAG: ribonuclease HI family protein [bacterium]